MSVEFSFRGSSYSCGLDDNCLTMARSLFPISEGYTFDDHSEFVKACEEAKTQYREEHGLISKPDSLPQKYIDAVTKENNIYEEDPTPTPTQEDTPTITDEPTEDAKTDLSVYGAEPSPDAGDSPEPEVGVSPIGIETVILIGIVLLTLFLMVRRA